MINYTTPSITLEVEGIDLTDNQDVYVTIVQGAVELTKKNEALTISYNSQTEVSTIVFSLTQEESASFQFARAAQLQVNFINASGVRDATNIASIDVLKNLLDEVIAYGS